MHDKSPTNTVIVHKHRTNILPVQLSYDVSDMTMRSQIRKGLTQDTDLIAEWEVHLKTDGRDGALVLILDDSATSEITETHGYMDMKRISDGEPYPVFEEAIPVLFRNVITE